MNRIWVSAAATLVALTGCAGVSGNGSAPLGSEETSAAPQGRAAHAATGPTMRGTGYTYQVPKGWGKPRQSIPGFNPDTFAINRRDRDKFVDNLNVLVMPGTMSVEEAEAQNVRGLQGYGASNVKIQERVTLAGIESAHLTATTSMNQVNYLIEQFHLAHDGQIVTVTFSFSDHVPPGARANVIDAVLASWVWTD